MFRRTEQPARPKLLRTLTSKLNKLKGRTGSDEAGRSQEVLLQRTPVQIYVYRDVPVSSHNVELSIFLPGILNACIIDPGLTVAYQHMLRRTTLTTHHPTNTTKTHNTVHSL